MAEHKRSKFKRILGTIIWMVCGLGTIVLLGAAVYKKNSHQCRAVQISIEGVRDNLFIDKGDVNSMLEKMSFGKLRLSPLNTFDLSGMEAFLKKNEWIKSAELYFDNNDILHINVTEREPVARVFDAAGASFYIDSSLKKLSLSAKFSARLPVFTNFPVTGKALSKADSNLLTEVKDIGIYIANDPFWMAQIEQVDITAARCFEMIPKIGNEVIMFGAADNFEEKFSNLLLFYKNVQSKVGWSKYATLNVAYKNQVVAVKRGAGDVKRDSLKTIELIKLLAATSQKQANDSVTNIQLVQPKEDNNIRLLRPPDENLTESEDAANDTLSNQIFNSIYNEKPSLLPSKKAIKKPVLKRPSIDQKKQSEAVTPAGNDY